MISQWFVHWKTSLLGIVAGALTSYAGGQSLRSVLAGAAIALLGLYTKDNDKP